MECGGKRSGTPATRRCRSRKSRILPRVPIGAPHRQSIYLLEPQGDWPAAAKIASAWLWLITPCARNAFAACATAETYCPWFLQAPPEAGPSQGANWSILHPSASTRLHGGVFGHVSKESGTPSKS